jgi:hypothetical protein
MATKGQYQKMEDRLERLSIPEPNSGCWLWTGGFDDRGHPFKPYGRIWVRGSSIVAHRASWLTYRGKIPDGMLVCHKCDTPLCINPDHLFLGTHKENTDDMISKGRDDSTRIARRGASSNFAKLTPAQVLSIRADPRLQRFIAKDYGISQPCVSLIKRFKNWSSLNGNA